MKRDVNVIVIGSGFGASVAALRFAESGKSVIVLERGGWITRETFEADDDMLWKPEDGRYGMNDLRKRGRHVVPWVGAGVGGGSHVYAATIKRRDFFDDFPVKITPQEMAPYYHRAEEMLQAVKYPDHAPYNKVESYILFREAEAQLQKEYPDLVEKQGAILLALSFASNKEEVGREFVNKYGAKQRYSDPNEQSILGGDIDVKNTLDKNYLFLAQQHGAEIRDFSEVTRIDSLVAGGYKVTWEDPRKDAKASGELVCDILVCAAGTIGSTQLLMQNKLAYKTLSKLSDRLGKSYFTNGDYITFILPKKGLLTSWMGLLMLLFGWILGNHILALVGAVGYCVGWWFSGKRWKPDKGTTNSDFIRFRHRDGSTQGVYIEGGRYPTPIKAVVSLIMSLFGMFKPSKYETISRVINFFGRYLPIFELLERSWPIPVLLMGRDDAVGSFRLDEKKEVEIDWPIEKNAAYVRYLEKLSALLAKKADCYFIPNYVAKIFKIVEVPHNLGGVCMGASIEKGVVDSYGRVFGYENFLVLDGSIMPNSLGPNPVGTILAFAERSLETVIEQLEKDGVITPD